MFNGQLHLIVDTIGPNVWVQKLNWSGLNAWNNAMRKPLYNQGMSILLSGTMIWVSQYAVTAIVAWAHVLPEILCKLYDY